jgi:hypothetical protein
LRLAYLLLLLTVILTKISLLRGDLVMEFRPLSFRFVISYVAIAIVLLSYDIYSFSFQYSGVFSAIFLLTLSTLLSISYITTALFRFRTKGGGMFHTTRLFLIPLIIVYGEIGLWTYIVLRCLSHLLAERKDKLFITYGCSIDYMSGFAFSHLFGFLIKDHPIALNSIFLISY